MYMEEKKQKQVYSAPLSELLEMTQETIICASPTFNKPFNDEQEW